jgi:hypothetical protein
VSDALGGALTIDDAPSDLARPATHGAPPHARMLRICSEPGCTIRCLGDRCFEHEAEETRLRATLRRDVGRRLAALEDALLELAQLELPVHVTGAREALELVRARALAALHAAGAVEARV